MPTFVIFFKLTSVTLKSRSNAKPGYVMWWQVFIFKMAAWRPQNRSNREKQKKGWAYCLTPSFIEIAPVVMKCTLLTDNDGCHVIAIAHQRWAKKVIACPATTAQKIRVGALYQFHVAVIGLIITWTSVHLPQPLTLSVLKVIYPRAEVCSVKNRCKWNACGQIFILYVTMISLVLYDDA
jgi:hypothetical protein